MSTNAELASPDRSRILVAIFPDEEAANAMVRSLIEKDYPMDLISILGRVHATGDDSIGIYHLNTGERMKAWGKQGAFWGGLWGTLAGAAGFFIIPGVGPVAAAGFIVEAIATGALLGAGSAAISQLAIAFHDADIPNGRISDLHKAIEEGKYLLMLRVDQSDLASSRQLLQLGNPLKMDDFPYHH